MIFIVLDAKKLLNIRQFLSTIEAGYLYEIFSFILLQLEKTTLNFSLVHVLGVLGSCFSHSFKTFW